MIKILFNLSRQKISLKKNKNTILTVGRLEDQKDMETLIKAFRLVVRKVNSNLIIIGYGSQFKKLKTIIYKNNLHKNVKILTNITNPFPYYKIAKTFCIVFKI